MERIIAPWLILVISALVLFTLLPNNRSSILIKELSYVLGASAMCLLTASAAFRRVPLNSSVGWKLTAVFAILLAWMMARHFSGTPSINGQGVMTSFAMLGLTAGTSALLLDAKGRSTVLLGLLSLFGLLCIYSMIQWMNVVIFPWDVYLGSSGRVSGSLGNPNLLGGMMAAFIPVAVGLLLGMEGRRPVRLTVMAVFCLLAILSIAASGTRGSLLGLASGLLFLAWFSLRRQAGGRRADLVIPLVALAAFLIICFVMRERLLELSSLGEGTARVRLVIWSGAAALIAANPFLGYGPGTFQIIFPEVRNPMYSILGTSHNTLHAHCEYLEILVEVGLVGALLFVWIAVMVLGSSLRGRDGTRRKLGLADAGVLAGIIAFLGEAFVSVSLRWPPGAFLFALLCGLLLAGGPGEPRPIPRISGFLLVIPALFTAIWGTGSYMTGMRSGHYLFMGKDQYLDKIESELALAANAAAAWEQTGAENRREEALQRFAYAWACSDSSIAICTRCVETNPEELGGWYGLGSAWLTRAILIEPINPSLSRLVEDAGYVRDHDLALSASRNALAAYESLQVRAPDYAEIHNNLALTYTRLGMPAMTMHSMRRAYQLHGHRRSDYLRQAFSISPLGGGFDALHILWQDRMQGFPEAGLSVELVERRLERTEWLSGYAMMFHPGSADSIAAALSAMCTGLPAGYPEILTGHLADQASLAVQDSVLFWKAMECDTSGILETALAGLASTGAVLPGHRAARATVLALRGDREGFAEIVKVSETLHHEAFPWLSLWPVNGGIPAPLFRSLPLCGSPASWRTVYLGMVMDLMSIDSFLLNRVQISRTDFSNGVSPETLGGFLDVWYGTGGMSAARDLGLDGPWVPGSAMEAAAAVADSIGATGPEGAANALAFHYLMLSSFWWGEGFSVPQRDYLLGRLESLRDSLDGGLGTEEARYAVFRLFEEIEPLLAQTGASDNPFLGILRNDIIEGEVTRSLGQSGDMP